MKGKNEPKENSRQYNIFVVEDSDIYRKMLVKFLDNLTRSSRLEGPEYRIHSFASGEECMENMYVHPDIVFLDYYLNDEGNNAQNMSGLELLRKIKNKHPDTEVVVLSKQQDVVVTAEMFRQGAADYIPKTPGGKSRIQDVMARLIKEIEMKRIVNRRMKYAAILVFVVGLALGVLLF